MNSGAALQALAGLETGAPPYGFEEFERRGARRGARRRALRQGVAASFATVGVAVLAAITLQQLRPVSSAAGLVAQAPQSMPALVHDTPWLPAEEAAVVDVGQLAVRESIADRIALLDMQLTEGRAYAVPEEEIAQLAATRQQLEQSLRSVRYAHALMTL